MRQGVGLNARLVFEFADMKWNRHLLCLPNDTPAPQNPKCSGVGLTHRRSPPTVGVDSKRSFNRLSV